MFVDESSTKQKEKETVEILAEEFGESTKYDILILFLIFF